MDYNQLIITGHVGRDAERGQTREGVTTLKFSVAVNQRSGGQETTLWISVTAWRALAETLAGRVLKGGRVLVAGRVSVREYTKRDGTPGWSLDLDAVNIVLLDKSGGGDATSDGIPF